ncbi:hypothetical protein PN398_07345 [Romboutsia sp. 1001216sp1]|uniref:hypothetical protein n=1 Tax=Romboutsia sp. 1001216sp1 TaxID=2986997 RepID=UPI00232E38C0|nr:hypothetical protein [Romboutsia sp. 1001216sp1]MDB8790531.1 hypothetical protein [Romboutsia sp. 1001216sp1]
MSLREMLKGNVVAVGKNYNELSGEELRLLLSLKCLSNKNNYIVGTNKSILINLFKLDKRTFDKRFNGLVEKGFILVEGEISQFICIKVVKDEVFEAFDVEFILNMLNDLTGAEVKLFCTLTTYLNEGKNRNYIYPSIEDIAKRYYEGDLTEEDLEKKIKNKGIDKIKNNLIEKGYIKKVVAYRFETKDGAKGSSKLAYFLKTNKNDVSDDEYYGFIKNEINKYNTSHANIIKLATEEYLKKCKYKNLDKYIYYVHQEFAAKEEMVDTNTTPTSEGHVIEEPKEMTENYVDIMHEFTVDKTDYKLEFEKLLNEKYSHLKSKKWEKYISQYGYEVMYNVLISGCVENNYGTGVFDKIKGDDAYRINCLFKDTYGAFKTSIEEISEKINKDKSEEYCVPVYDEYLSVADSINSKTEMQKIIDRHKELNCVDFSDIIKKYTFNAVTYVLVDNIEKWEKSGTSILQQLKQYIHQNVSEE